MNRQGNQKRKIRSNTSKVLLLLMAVCVIGILCSGYFLISINREYAKGDKSYEQVRQTIGHQTGRPIGHQKAASSIDQPSVSDTDGGGNIDFNALRAINPDVVAWITAPGSIIDYPVVQGRDNDYYLTHLFNGTRNKLGSLFVDYRDPGDFTGKVAIVYGHNMKDGSMFASLTKYKKQSYYDEHRFMQLSTPDGSYRIEWFAGIVASGDYEFIRHHFTGDDDFLSYTDTLKKSSTFQSEVSVNVTDRIVALCTCSYEYNNARYALFGRLVPDDKS